MMVYEMLWTRTILEFSYDKSSYVYTVVIVGVLTGLSTGSFITRKWIDTWKNPVMRFSVVEYLAGAASLAGFMAFSVLSPHLFNARMGNDTWFHVSGREYLLFFILTAIPAFFMGISYPLAGRIITGNLGRLGSRMGLLSFTDTIGSVAGPAIGGFVMLRYLDVYQSFLVCVSLNVASGIFLMAFNSRFRLTRRILFPASALGLIVISVLAFPRGAYYRHKAGLYPGEHIVAMKEGVTATVTITDRPLQYQVLAINGAKTAFTNSEDQRVHKMLAYLPWFFNPGAGNAAVIGYGLGITTRCLAELGIRTDLAELSPEVLELSSRHFNYLNHNILTASNVTVHVEDGRSMLQRSTGKYDLITTNAVHPRLGPNLYSADFYRLCRDRLPEEGTICQWVPTNWMSETEFKSLIRAFTDVFPHSLMWYVNRSHTLIVGSKAPLEISYAKLSALFQRTGIRNELSDVDLGDPESVLAGFFLTGEELSAWAASTSPDTDDKPVIEYSFVTDPRPNRAVLMKLIDSPPDFSRLISFPDTASAEFKNSVLLRVNMAYRQNISTLQQLVRRLQDEDSPGH